MRRRHTGLSSLAVFACLLACGGDDGGGGGKRAIVNDTPWPMHTIDDRFRGANALGAADVNGDGFTDYVTNYEFDQRYVIALHPGRGGDVKAPWPTAVAYFLGGRQDGVDTEHAALGDLDGDGNLDVVGAQGWHTTAFFEGQNAGVRIVWGPPAARLFDESAWIDAGRIPATIDQGHFLWVVPYDVNGDGALDILAGGRLHEKTLRNASIKWIEAPAERAERRDLSRWTVHDIDPEGFDGHGFVLTDIDEDGDPDLADANADFDTPEEEETVHWYENPGPGSEAQKTPWPKHEIYRGSEFYAKPQIAVADLDGDGYDDLITQVEDAIYWFRKTGVHPVAWERIVIPKDPVARWIGRPVRVADLDGDGRLDIFAMLTHVDGVIPGTTASAFWMSYSGDRPTADNWTTHVVKWGSGKPMFLPAFGEKWDQVQLDDVDRDGDLDILANCEEWWADYFEVAPYWDPLSDPTSVSVVWFENRLGEEPYRFAERGGRAVIEAEHHSDARDGSWVSRNRHGGYGGDGYLQDHNVLGSTPRAWDETRGFVYETRLAGGTYHVWLRTFAPARWGEAPSGLGGTASDSAWLGADGVALGVVGDATGPFDAWTWVRLDSPVQLAAGDRVIELRVREGGFAVDRIVLAAGADFVPAGVGPAETLR
jgi:hypothetical protein